MEFQNLIKSHNWLSVELTLINLYPEQKELIDDYKKVFENLQTLDAEIDEMLIVLKEYHYENEDDIYFKTYVDVSGRKLGEKNYDSMTDSYAIEFIKWEKWLGMSLAPETIENFSELEIIAHCLFEMTFCGYEQEEIQEEFESINKTIDDYKNLTNQEKKRKKNII